MLSLGNCRLRFSLQPFCKIKTNRNLVTHVFPRLAPVILCSISFYYINCSGIASGSKSRKMVSHVWIKMVSTHVISFFTNQLTEFAMLQCSMGQGLSILSRNIFGSSSAIFGNFRKTSGNVRKHSYDYRTTFSKSSENGRKSSENRQKPRY